MEEIKKLLELLAKYGGSIVSTASLDVMQINQARASGRMHIDENSLGYVWEPDIKLIPTTVEEVKFFEKWYPLEIELPESLKDPSFLWTCGGAKCQIPNCVVCKNEMY